jgi:hypothetical protein
MNAASLIRLVVLLAPVLLALGTAAGFVALPRKTRSDAAAPHYIGPGDLP